MPQDIIDIEVDEVITGDGKSARTAKKPKKASSSREEGSPQMPHLGFKQRLMAKFMMWMMNPKVGRFYKKWRIPIFILGGLLFLSLSIILVPLILLYFLLKAILRPYLDVFTRRG